jgi:hypothetical protein
VDKRQKRLTLHMLPSQADTARGGPARRTLHHTALIGFDAFQVLDMIDGFGREP